MLMVRSVRNREPAPAMALLAAQSLTVTARIGGEAIPVIRSLDFTLERGRILGLVGESGAGKSMVGRAIAQLLPPGFAVTGGRLDFAGDDLVTMPAERRRARRSWAIRANTSFRIPFGMDLEAHLLDISSREQTEKHVADMRHARILVASQAMRRPVTAC
jgi:ABC-type dipeptide/oligopeptide/nickel transport system ATPase component